MENSGKSKLAVAVLSGAAVGAAIWYFMKSENGKENWSAIVDTVKDLSDKLKTSAEEHKEKLSDLSHKASDYLSDKASEAAKYARNHADDIASRVSEGAKTASNHVENIASKAAGEVKSHT